jgi:hypothetical protein
LAFGVLRVVVGPDRGVFEEASGGWKNETSVACILGTALEDFSYRARRRNGKRRKL